MRLVQAAADGQGRMVPDRIAIPIRAVSSLLALAFPGPTSCLGRGAPDRARHELIVLYMTTSEDHIRQL